MPDDAGEDSSSPGSGFINRRAGRVGVLLAGLLLAACQGPAILPAPGPVAADRTAATEGDGATVHVTSNGWHTTIVVARADLPTGAIPEAEDFPDAAWLGFGWGDAAYFPAPDPGPGAMLRAVLLPTPAVMHLLGLPAHPREIFPEDEIVALDLGPGEFRALVAWLDGSFARDGARRARAVAPGLHEFSRFYPARGEFHLFYTCNDWTADAMRAAGRPPGIWGPVRPEVLMVGLRAAGGRTVRRE